MSNYGIALHITGENLNYFNKVIKFLTSEECTVKDIQYFNRSIDRNMLKNEHYLVTYYIDYLNKIEPISQVNLDLIEKFTDIDKEKIVDLQNIDLTGIVDVKEEFKGNIIVEMMKSYSEDIRKLESVTREEFEHYMQLLIELVKDLKSNNVLFVGSRILNGEYRVGRRILKGRNDFIEFLVQETREIRNLEKDSVELMYALDRDTLLTMMYTSDPLFPHPIPTLQSEWGSIRRGTTLGIMAGMSVGKTTLTINYLAKALECGINSGLFISEMNISKYISRIISIIGANKYRIFLASSTVEMYLDLQHKLYMNKSLTNSDKAFLESNKTQINNIEYILNQLFSESNEDLGTLHLIPELVLEDIPELYRTLEQKEVYFIVIDHINGLSSLNTRKGTVELTNEGYVSIHGESKKHGVATVITNHIPDEYLSKVDDLDADLSNIRGSNAGQSTKSLDDVLILSATDEQKQAGELVIRTNKNRDSGVFFEPILVTHRKEIGLLYESN